MTGDAESTHRHRPWAADRRTYHPRVEASEDRPDKRAWSAPRWLRDWTVVVPIVGAVVVAFAWGAEIGMGLGIPLGVLLGASVLAAVHHAEVVAHRVGEPFGSLILALAVTAIEVALIVTLMATGGPENASLARDSVFAAVMITTN